MSVAERYAEVGMRQFVLLHREAIVGPSRVGAVAMLKEGAYISIVDGLSEVASEETLASQGGTEYGVCRLGIAERKADIADAIERDESVLECSRVLLKAECLCQMQGTVMIIDCFIEHTHSSIVSADIV